MCWANPNKQRADLAESRGRRSGPFGSGRGVRGWGVALVLLLCARVAKADMPAVAEVVDLSAAALRGTDAGQQAMVPSSEAKSAGSGTAEETAASSGEKSKREIVGGLWGRPVRRGGFHLQIEFGIGGGPDTLGLFHEMELGYTFGRRGQHTVGLLHTFIQNRGMMGTDRGGPDLIGGWMVEYKHPLHFPDLVGKIALGLGGTHDQSGEKLKAHGGFGVAYGVDLNFPWTKRFGPTWTLLGMNVVSQGQHHFGVSLGIGFTLF